MKRLGGLGLLLLFSLFLCGNGLVFPFHALFLLAFGWIPFLVRTLPEITVRPLALVEVTATVGLLLWGGHRFGAWLCAGSGRGAWTVRATIATLAGVVMMFAASVASAGVIHQVAWMMSDPEPRLMMQWGRTGIRQAHEICSAIDPLKTPEENRRRLWDIDLEDTVVLPYEGEMPGTDLLIFPRDPSADGGLFRCVSGNVDAISRDELEAHLAAAQP